MVTETNLVIALIPGAWHTPEHYKHLTGIFVDKGYHLVVHQNASCNSQTPNQQDVEADVAAIRDDLLRPFIDAGRHIVLVMHSYGGCPGAAAAVGWSRQEGKDQGKPGGIIGLAFISAFVANEGDSLISKLPGQTFEPWHILSEDGQIKPDRPNEIFYADVPSHIVEQAISALQVQSQASFTSKSPLPAWPLAVYNGRRSYLQCTEDQAIPIIGQEMMLKYSGVEWDITRIQSSHSPHLSQPQETAAWLERQVEAFVAAA